MRLATISSDGRSFSALIVDDGYVDLTAHIANPPADMQELILRWDDLRQEVADLANSPADGSLQDIVLEAPLARPGKIFAIGLNYADHCEETGMDLPTEQIWFTKATSAVNGPFSPVAIPAVSDSLDYEAEMVAVIGKTCRNVPADRFADVIFGYATGNDFSVREWQIETSQWSLGKSFDTTAPFGPWITTGDAIDPDNLAITCEVNGEVRQNSNTRHLVFKMGDMIAKLSNAMTLEPGDIIFTGTPGGVGMMWKGEPHYLKTGDRVRCEIEELGVIENMISAGSATTQII